MILKTIPKFISLDVFKIDNTTNEMDLIEFLLSGSTKATVSKIRNGFLINADKEGIVYKEGTLLFFIDGKLHYISPEDESVFWEFFQENTDGVKVRVSGRKRKEKESIQQFQCPECNFVFTTPFDICPNCGANGNNIKSLEFTDITTKLKRGNKMANSQNNVEEVQEVEETKVTAVYGDCVSVNNSEVQTNVKTTETNNEEASCI